MKKKKNIMKNEIHNHDEHGCIRICMHYYCSTTSTNILLSWYLWWILPFYHVSFWWRAHIQKYQVFILKEILWAQEREKKNLNSVDELPSHTRSSSQSDR